MAHTTIGHLKELKKKKLLLAVMMMNEEEFDALAKNRNLLIAESSNIDSPIPAPELIVDSIRNAIEGASDMSGNVDGIVGDEEGI